MPQNVVIWEILISWLTGVFLKFNALYLRIAWCVADTGRVVIRLTALLWIMCAFFFFSTLVGNFTREKEDTILQQIEFE